MEPRKPGNKELPDFDSLDDRIIAERSSSKPILVIKTNLDPKDSTENNPYFHNSEETNIKEFKDFFEE
ncbi:hypothetical protein [Bacillus massilinigeriensis]|uniref:hypothetical protein n=1 Tax=Bacillus massilionigeriensis TaxID=1805475 RepID=UPI00096AF11B